MIQASFKLEVGDYKGEEFNREGAISTFNFRTPPLPKNTPIALLSIKR